MTLIRVAAIADNNARICGTAHGISEAAMNFYSQNNCQRLLKADEINITRQQAAFDATSESNRDGMAAFCTEARAYSDEKAAMFGLTK